MRIISGTHRGRIITPPKSLRARPTTDFARENLFNVLAGLVDLEECDVLDLFSGTGAVAYEFASRGARSVTAVEINPVHHAFIAQTARTLGFSAPPKDVLRNSSTSPREVLRNSSTSLRDALRNSSAPAREPSFFAVKANVFNYLAACTRQFDVIFSDAPYDLAGSEKVVETVFARGLLRPAGAPIQDESGAQGEDGEGVSAGGLLIFEHSKEQNFAAHPHLLQTRSYGSVQFSIFK